MWGGTTTLLLHSKSQRSGLCCLHPALAVGLRAAAGTALLRGCPHPHCSLRGTDLINLAPGTALGDAVQGELTPLPDGQGICAQGRQQSLCEGRRGLPQVEMDVSGDSSRFCSIPVPEPLKPLTTWEVPQGNRGKGEKNPAGAGNKGQMPRWGKGGIAHPTPATEHDRATTDR